jgi:hypothetical protein
MQRLQRNAGARDRRGRDPFRTIDDAPAGDRVGDRAVTGPRLVLRLPELLLFPKGSGAGRESPRRRYRVNSSAREARLGEPALGWECVGFVAGRRLLAELARSSVPTGR